MAEPDSVGEPIVLTEPLGGSALSRAARAGQLPQWYPTLPRDEQGWSRHVTQVRDSANPDWLRQLEPAIAPRGAAAARLQNSANGNGIVVTTGQQPGLFGGPLMTLVKALSARAFADTLAELVDVPVAPLFWAATDDADFDEAAVVSVTGSDGAHELRLETRAASGTPMARQPLGREMAALADVLREACGSAPHPDYLAAALRSYHNGATIGSAYVALLREMLEPLEIAVLDASHAAVAQAAAPLLRRAARDAESVAAAARERIAAIIGAGFTPQVEEVPGLSLVFLNENGLKRRLPIREAIDFADPGPDRFLSATVLLRPVVERALVPTAVYFGGPGEIAYFAQVSAVADALGAARPSVAPRWSTTIIESRVSRVLRELEITIEELATPNAVEGRLAREHVSPAVEGALRSLRGDLASNMDALRRASEGVVSGPVVDGLERSLEHRIARFERRVLAGVKRHETELMRTVAAARGALFPHGARQERKLSYIPFLTRNGPALIERMLDAARAHARALVLGAPGVSPPAASTPATL
ncbi:MAG TPA: bacillithiol biosynthesis BshC [Gemmatimonadaceae bacterium]|nr:bacillithiol biosynthesis BshC [Gemmatimonadaceae bacterium]